MKKFSQKLVATMTITAMIVALFAGTIAIPTKVNAQVVDAVKEHGEKWTYWGAPDTWTNGAYNTNRINSVNSTGFMAMVSTTGWAACWDANMPGDFSAQVVNSCWADNPIAAEAYLRDVKVYGGIPYTLKMHVDNQMVSESGTPTEKNITVLVCLANYNDNFLSPEYGMCADYGDPGAISLKKTYTIEPAGSIDINETFNMITDATNKVAIIVQFGPYFYSYSGGTAEGFALAPGTTEGPNCKGTLTVTDVSMTADISGVPTDTTPAKKSVKLGKAKIKFAQYVGNKTVAVQWKAVKNAKKYQVRFNNKKTYKTSKTSLRVKNSMFKKTKKTKKIKIQVRAYTGKNTSKIAYKAGAWSKAKTIKIK